MALSWPRPLKPSARTRPLAPGRSVCSPQPVLCTKRWKTSPTPTVCAQNRAGTKQGGGGLLTGRRLLAGRRSYASNAYLQATLTCDAPPALREAKAPGRLKPSRSQGSRNRHVAPSPGPPQSPKPALTASSGSCGPRGLRSGFRRAARRSTLPAAGRRLLRLA